MQPGRTFNDESRGKIKRGENMNLLPFCPAEIMKCNHAILIALISFLGYSHPQAQTVDFESQVQPIFTNNCAGCHPPFGGMNLSVGQSYDNLVDITSANYSPALRVARLDSLNSVLWNKIADTGLFGDRMPLGRPPLPQSNISLIAIWISELKQISVDVETIDFGEIAVGDSLVLSLNVANTSPVQTLTVSSVVSTDSAYLPIDTAFSIAGGGSFDLNILFHPTEEGLFLDTLTIINSDSLEPAVQVVLIGSSAFGAHALSAAQLEFGSVAVGQSENDTLYIENVGTVSITVTVTPPQSDEFFALPLSELVAPGDSLTIPVTFTPSSDSIFFTDFLMVGSPAGTDTVELSGIGIVVSVTDEFILPENAALHQNYPNPFNPQTTLSYSIPIPGSVSLKIYNILGKEILSLVSEFQPAGNYEITWDASNIASGVYLYRLQTGDFVRTKKMVLLK